MPKLQVTGEGFQSKLRAEFRGCHSYNINSISIAPDEECFLSADDLRINMWSFKDPNLAYNIIDLKPPHLEELQEVITHVEYHPQRSDIFLFSSSKGYMSYCDLRVSSQAFRGSTTFLIEEDPSKKNFFTDIVRAVSKACFNPSDPTYIVSRDYIAVHIWDIRNY